MNIHNRSESIVINQKEHKKPFNKRMDKKTLEQFDKNEILYKSEIGINHSYTVWTS